MRLGVEEEMASKYWIKLYHEIIDDPKMGCLTDRLWRRAIELFLMAGDINKDGELPPVKDISWRLRISIDELEIDLENLEKEEILHKSDDTWFVTNFEKRQKPMKKDEYMRRLRDDRKSDVFVTDELLDSDQDVTDVLPEVTQNKIEIEIKNNNSVEQEEELENGNKYFDDLHDERGEPAPREHLTAEQRKERTRKAANKFGENSQGKNREIETYLSKVGEHVRPLARVFCEYKSRPPTKKENSYWRKAWEDQYEIGLKPENITMAIDKMNKDGLTIKSPESVTAIAEDLQTNKTSQSPQATEVWTSEGQVY